jgi:26S proteasome regulatory subunit N5
MEGKLEKMERDWTKEVDEALVQTSKVAQAGNLTQAIDTLSVLEKQTRTSADLSSNKKVLLQIVELCFVQKDFKALNEQVVVLMKKRGLLKQAVTTMIQKVLEFIQKTQNVEQKLELIETVRNVCDGKVYNFD